MKNAKKLPIVVIFSALLFSSCVKQLDAPVAPVVAPTTGVVTKFADMQVADNFNWATTTPIMFTVNGAASADYQLLLKVLDPDGNVVLKKMHNGSEKYSATIQLPSRFQFVTVSFGDTSEKIDCVNNTVTLNIK